MPAHIGGVKVVGVPEAIALSGHVRPKGGRAGVQGVTVPLTVTVAQERAKPVKPVTTTSNSCTSLAPPLPLLAIS